MRSRFGGLAPVVLVFAAACDTASPLWMERTFADRTDTEIGTIVLPGTHDSASYGVAVENGMSPNSGDLLVNLWNLPGGDLPGGSQERAVGWARTQDRTIAEQLEDGIRYVDIRVTVRDGELVTWHSVYSVPLSVVLDDMVAFSVAHPREVVVLSFGLDLVADDYPAFADALTEPRADGTSLCDLLLDAPGPATYVTLADAWSRGRPIVWGADGELKTWLAKNTTCVTSNAAIEGHWSITTTPEGVSRVLTDTVDNRDPDKLLSNDFIFSLEGTSDRLAQLNFITTYPSLIEASAALGFSGDFPGQMIEQHDATGRMNIFAGDRYQATNLIEAAIAANQPD